MSQQPGSALQCTPATYARALQGNPDGQVMFADLTHRFYRNPYVKGGADAERETIFRAGQLSVILHMMKQCGMTEAEDQNAEA
jgi:hypothetical protein